MHMYARYVCVWMRQLQQMTLRYAQKCCMVFLSVVKAWVGLTAAKIARAVRVCTRHRMLCNCGLLNTATLMFTFA